MGTRTQLPVALTIAGSDSGGGAGIQADLRTFAALGVHGTSVITCLTAQNPKEVLAIEASSPNMIAQQLEAVFKELKPAALKTGMLYSRQIIQTVADFFRQRGYTKPIIVDPVLIATSGATLLQQDAIEALKSQLLPAATLVTPNLPETEALTGTRIKDPEGMRQAARRAHEQFGCAVLVKGGHLGGSNSAIDVFYDGKEELLLSAPYIKRLHLHGTGCTYSAAIAAGCALGLPLSQSVAKAKEHISSAIANCVRVGRHFILKP